MPPEEKITWNKKFGVINFIYETFFYPDGSGLFCAVNHAQSVTEWFHEFKILEIMCQDHLQWSHTNPADYLKAG